MRWRGRSWSIPIAARATVIRAEMSRYLQRAGVAAEAVEAAPEPWASGLRGDWREAAARWAGRGEPYEQALELVSGEDDVERRLGPRPPAHPRRERHACRRRARSQVINSWRLLSPAPVVPGPPDPAVQPAGEHVDAVGPHDTAVGCEVSTPPSDSHADQPLSCQRWARALSCPRANTSSRPLPQELTAGPEVSEPPRDSHPDQALSYHRWTGRCPARGRTRRCGWVPTTRPPGRR